MQTNKIKFNHKKNFLLKIITNNYFKKKILFSKSAIT